MYLPRPITPQRGGQGPYYEQGPYHEQGRERERERKQAQEDRYNTYRRGREREREQEREREREREQERSQPKYLLRNYPPSLRTIIEPLLENQQRRERFQERLSQIHEDINLRRSIQANFLTAIDALDSEDEARERDCRIDSHVADIDHVGPDRDEFPKDDLVQIQKSPCGVISRPLSRHDTGDDALAKLFDQQPVSLEFTNVDRTQREPPTAHQTQTVNVSAAASPQEPPFISWENFSTYTVPASDNFVQEHYEGILATYDTLNIGMKALNSAVILDGFVKKIRDWFHKEDILSLWRAKNRQILLPPTPDDAPSVETILAKDKQLFDTSKYFSFDNRLTTITYSDGHYGSIMLLKASSTGGCTIGCGSDITCAKKIEPIAAMEHVPKKILIKMESSLNDSHKKVLKSTQNSAEWTPNVGKGYPARVFLRGLRENIPNGFGEALGTAIGADPDSRKADGFIATIPQTLALFHMKASILCSIETSEVKLIRHTYSAGDSATFAPGPTKRWVSLVRGPELTGHESKNPRIVVLHSDTGFWIRERMFWN